MIEIENLTKRYGDTVAVDGLSFVVEPGVVTGGSTRCWRPRRRPRAAASPWPSAARQAGRRWLTRRLAGVAATLLHYGTSNPLSVPFWSRMGYRPLVRIWATHPAGTLRRRVSRPGS